MYPIPTTLPLPNNQQKHPTAVPGSSREPVGTLPRSSSRALLGASGPPPPCWEPPSAEPDVGKPVMETPKKLEWWNINWKKLFRFSSIHTGSNINKCGLQNVILKMSQWESWHCLNVGFSAFLWSYNWGRGLSPRQPQNAREEPFAEMFVAAKQKQFSLGHQKSLCSYYPSE